MILIWFNIKIKMFPKELLGIIYSYLNWVSDQKYLHLQDSTEYIERVWKKHTIFIAKRHCTIHGEFRYSCSSCLRPPMIHYVNGTIHRDSDFPAIEWDNGDSEWWMNGKLHRERDKPAIYYNNYKVWLKYNKIHRNGDKPAEISDKFTVWYRNGNKHRDDDKPAVEHVNGYKEWYNNGKCSRKELVPRYTWRDYCILI